MEGSSCPSDFGIVVGVARYWSSAQPQNQVLVVIQTMREMDAHPRVTILSDFIIGYYSVLVLLGFYNAMKLSKKCISISLITSSTMLQIFPGDVITEISLKPVPEIITPEVLDYFRTKKDFLLVS